MYKFSENSRVCFFGDSITHNGLALRRIYDYYRNTLGIKLEMYNCGVSGDYAEGAIRHINETMLCFDPTDVVINFGMNDVSGGYYMVDDVDFETVSQRRRAIDVCLENIEKIADLLYQRGINLIFCSPTPYDELTEDSVTPYFVGMDGGLREIGERVKCLSKKYGGNFVDYHSVFYKGLTTFYKQGKCLINPDRIHPNAEGQELMAQIFLSSQGFDIDVTYDFQKLTELSKYEYDEWENIRYDYEQKYKHFDFFTWCFMYGKTEQEKIEFCKKLISENENEFFVSLSKEYLDGKKLSLVSEYKEKLVVHTKSVK